MSLRAETDRRKFLAKAGKYAAVTPPAMTMLLSTTLTSPAIAASGKTDTVYLDGPNGNNGNNGNHYGQIRNGNNGNGGGPN
jgi:hypothetical protein